MLAKSLLAGMVSAIMAGSVVYFGTNPVAKSTPQSELPAQTDTTEVKVAEIVKVPSQNTISQNTIKADGVVDTPTPIKEKWLDQYLKTPKEADNKKSETALHPHPKKPAEVVKESVDITEPKDDKKENVARKYQDLEAAPEKVEKIVAPEIETAKTTDEAIDEDVENSPELETAKIIEAVPETYGSAAIEQEVEDKEVNINLIPNADIPDAALDHKTDVVGHDLPDLMSVPEKGLYGLTFKQIAAIEAQELKNQAYFILANKAMEDNCHPIAKIAIDKITAPEMKETARINLAVSYGRAGHHEAAFNLVNEVEQGEYRDILRLQVIEAILQPVESSQTPLAE